MRPLPPTEPIDVGQLLAIDPPRSPQPLREPRSSDARADRRQWHRRGMRSPEEIAALVHERVHLRPPAVTTAGSTESVDPAYGDFFLEPQS